MPRRRARTTRPSLDRNIEALRPIVRNGIPWLSPESQKERTRYLSIEQKILLSHLTPYKCIGKFMPDLDPDPETVAAAREALKAEITTARRKEQKKIGG